jgi:ribosome-binding ATPase
MKIGIIGPPQSGKSTIFKILLGNKDISGNIGVFKARDSRLEKIAGLVSAKKLTYPEFIFMDLGPVSGFNKKDLSQLQDIDMFICAAGAFFSDDPKKDLESAVTDIILFDLDIIQTRMARLQKEARGADSEKELKVLDKCQAFISEGKFLRKAGLDKEEIKLLSGLFFLSMAPLIVAINLPEEDISGDKIKELERYCLEKELPCVKFFGKAELEIMDLEPEEREKFSKELGPGYSFKEDMSRLISKELELITFFTAGEKDTRGWHLRSGLPAIEAAGKIHSDIKRGFIRAEVISYGDFIQHGSFHKAREAGTLRLEGKDYIIQDGDIINIRFSV